MLFGIWWFEKEYILVLFTCICHYYISSMCCRLIHPCVFADRSMSQSTAKNVWYFCLGFDQDGIPARWRWLTLDFLCLLRCLSTFTDPVEIYGFWLKVSENDRSQRWCSNDLYWMCLKKKGLHFSSPIDIHFFGHPDLWKSQGRHRVSEVVFDDPIWRSHIFQMGWFGRGPRWPYLGDVQKPYLLSTYKSWDDPPSSATVPQMRIMVVNKPFRPWGGPLRFSW